MEKGEQG